MSLRPDLDAEMRMASHKKIPLGMNPDQSTYLKEIVLKISKISLLAFDVLDSDQVSEHDVLELLQLPDYVNQFTGALRDLASDRIAGRA